MPNKFYFKLVLPRAESHRGGLAYTRDVYNRHLAINTILILSNYINVSEVRIYVVCSKYNKETSEHSRGIHLTFGNISKMNTSAS